MGQKYAVVNEAGEVSGFLDDDINVIFPGAFPISYLVWQDWCARQTTVRWTGEALEDKPPAAPRIIRVIRSLAFRDRLTTERQSSINVAATQAAAAGDGTLLTFLLNQAASTTTNLDDSRVMYGVSLLLSSGLITFVERDALLADGTAEEAA